MSLQLPVAVSKKSARRKGSRAIQSSNQLSTCGRTGSRTSNARESRFGVSVCSPTPKPGSSPRADNANPALRFKQGKAIVQNGVDGSYGKTRPAG